MKVIVVGSGIAGLVAALELAREHETTLVTKSRLAESNTRYAQGGIAAVMTTEDSVAEHVSDTLRAGAGLCRLEAVEILCAEGPARVRDLIALGVDFDRKQGELAQGREAAHSRARVLHAGGDATGLAIETALVAAVRDAGIPVLEHTFASDLLLAGDRVCGLEVIDPDGLKLDLKADAVMLASGGAGHLYPYTTNPSVATGDGVALALRAGAQLTDVEFYQFHPTALSASGGFLISEAVRGDGAVLRAADGSRFMQAVHPDAELAPRDVVARGIAEQMARQNGQPVTLDATALGAEFLATRFPTINAACQRAGLDWARTPVPVAPAAHYWMGGVQTDVWGRTSVRGLFAVGEVACTGVHGANRLASNSLLESLVFAWRAAHLLVSKDDSALRNWPTFESTFGERLNFATESAQETTDLPSREALQQLMWESAGIVRDEPRLLMADSLLRSWEVHGSSVYDRETANLLLLARAVVAAALARHESRGAHARTDFPLTSEAERHHIAVTQPVQVPC
ncbi:MAG: L-aspartate oxidase [Janthinobacterium lividum]